MKPLELSCITEVWKSALRIIGEEVASIGQDLQLWFPWGNTWRGHDLKGTLPPTDLPRDLVDSVSRFGGRFWKPVTISGSTWLLSIRAPMASGPQMESWEIPEKVEHSLQMLGDFVRLEGLLGLFMKILENRANEHVGHWDRVRNLSVAIGRDLGLSIKELADLEVAALLHDIGKIGLPDSLLMDTGPLDKESRKKIESHSIVGAAMIREIPGMDKIADYVLFHHESPNGKGYPKGLKEDEIPLGALVISAADAFDSMTHYRPYATERTYLESFNELRKEDGSFSGVVLASMENVLKRLGILDSKPFVKEFID
jgi:putative nucleotidyltransferase with HDIG domain